jgi:hypothetical protein
MKNQVKCDRRGTINIVSSGYSDRYAVSDIYFVVTVNGLEFRIDNDQDRVAGYLRLMGHNLQNLPDDIFKQAIEAVGSSPISTWISYKSGNAHKSIKTKTQRISAGIHAARNYESLNEFGRSEYEPVAKTLTRDEWDAVRYGLQRINDEHAAIGKPIVEFTIPNEEA